MSLRSGKCEIILFCLSLLSNQFPAKKINLKTIFSTLFYNLFQSLGRIQVNPVDAILNHLDAHPTGPDPVNPHKWPKRHFPTLPRLINLKI